MKRPPREGPHLGTCHVCGKAVWGYAAGLIWHLPGPLRSVVLCRGACEEQAGQAIARALRVVAGQGELAL
jgi:hypothetical protein